MGTFVGRRINPKAAGQAGEPKPEQKADLKPEQKPGQKADKTRSELVQEAEELGISVPRNASKAQIQKIIDEAPVM